MTLVAQAVSAYQVNVAGPHEGVPQLHDPHARVSAMPVPAVCRLGNAAGQVTMPGVARQTEYGFLAGGAQTWLPGHPPPAVVTEHVLPAGAGGVVDVTIEEHPLMPETGNGATSW